MKIKGLITKSMLQLLHISCGLWRGVWGGRGDSGGENGPRNPEEEKKTERKNRKMLEKTFSNFTIIERADLKRLTSS